MSRCFYFRLKKTLKVFKVFKVPGVFEVLKNQVDSIHLPSRYIGAAEDGCTMRYALSCFMNLRFSPKLSELCERKV